MVMVISPTRHLRDIGIQSLPARDVPLLPQLSHPLAMHIEPSDGGIESRVQRVHFLVHHVLDILLGQRPEGPMAEAGA